MLHIKTLVLKKDKIDHFLLNNLGNILLVTVLLGAFKKIILPNNYVRGVLIDYSLLKIYISNFILLVLLLFFLKVVLQKKKYLLIIFAVLIINLLFSQNPLFTLIYIFNYLPILIFIVTFSSYKFFLNYKFIFWLNIIYIIIFILQFAYSSSFFPYFPFGFFTYVGVSPNLDFFSLFGSKVVLPIANFPHSNVFAAFLSFLNIAHFYNKKIFFVIINLLLVTILSSFASILFNVVLLALYIKTYVPLNTNKKYFYWFLFFLISSCSLYFFTLYGFKFVSILERVNQLSIFLYIFLNYPFFGVGLNNFIYSINFFELYKGSVFVLQPIHNLFLLMLVEGGLFLISLLVLFLYKQKRLLKGSPYILFILVLGFFDHYFFTLNQGLLILALTILLHKSIINNKNV